MKQLTEKQAFDAMRVFLNEYFERAGDDLETLLSDIEMEPDGKTHDPAAWSDWTRCVRSTVGSEDS